MKKTILVLPVALATGILLSGCVSTDCGPEPSSTHWQSAAYVPASSGENDHSGQKPNRELLGIGHTYWNQVGMIVTDALIYPKKGIDHYCEGSARIRVRIKPDGTVMTVDLVTPAGAGYLDKEALDVMQRIGQLPPVPSPAPGAEYYVFEMPINFTMPRR